MEFEVLKVFKQSSCTWNMFWNILLVAVCLVQVTPIANNANSMGTVD